MQDLLDRRRTLSRKARRRQGHTEFRDDEDLDLKDPHGKRLVDPEPRGRSRSKKEKGESSSSVPPSTGSPPTLYSKSSERSKRRAYGSPMGASPKRDDDSPDRLEKSSSMKSRRKGLKAIINDLDTNL